MTSAPASPSPPSLKPDEVAAVVFDIGGVFCYPACMPVAALMDAEGLETPADLMDFRKAHHAGVRALSDAHRYPDEHDPDFWAVYDSAYARAVGVPDEAHQVLRPAMRNRWNWLHDENIAAFHRLAATDTPVAIVSNNDGSAPDQMRNFGVCQVGPGPLPSVAAIVDSTLEGVAKPDPAIFAPALGALGLPAHQVLYVGDTVHADVAGATAAGMQVVQLDPFDHHADLPHSRCADLDELLGLLGHSD